MPIPFQNKIAVNVEELVPEFFKTFDYLKTKVYLDEKRGYGMKRLQSGGNGRQLLIDFDTLPRHIQESIGDPRKEKHILAYYYTNSQEAVDFYTTYTFTDGKHIDPEIQEKYITNASVLNACIDLMQARINERNSKKLSLRGVATTIFNDAMSFNQWLQKTYNTEHNLPTNERRFLEKFNQYKEFGLPILISQKHGNSNGKLVNDELEQFFNNMFATQPHKPNHYEIHCQYNGFIDGYVEIINNETGELYNNKEKHFKKVSAGTVYNYLTKWNNTIATHKKRSGDRQVYMAKFKPHHSLDRPKYAGSLISIDDRQPPFEYVKGKRMWFYNGTDVSSDCVTAFVYGTEKEGIILDFYRQLVRNYAEWGFRLPAELECESSLNSSFAKTFLQEGTMFQYVRIEANNARGKIIERTNEKMRYELEKKQLGWIARPFAKDESNQEGSTPVPTIPYDKLVVQCLKNIETYNNMPCAADETKTRWEYFCENQNPNLKPTNYKAFLKYIGYKTKTSCNVGIIKLQGGECLLGDNGNIFTGDSLINIMTLIEGQDVDVYWLDANDGSVLKALVYFNDVCICEAIAKPRYNRSRIEQNNNDMQAREIMSKYVATIESFGREQYKNITNLTVIDNIPVTLNNKFKIAQIQERVEVIPGSDFETEILPEINEYEYELIGNERPVKSELKYRF